MRSIGRVTTAASGGGDLIARYLREAGEIIARIDHRSIGTFVDVLFDAWRAGRTVYTFGNGGSAATAQHLACDLFAGTRVEGRPRLRALCLNDNMPLVSALTNDEGYERIYVSQLEVWWQPGDVALGVSVHGGVGRASAGPWSQNVLAALRHANARGGRSLGLVGFDGGAMRDLCDASIIVPAASTPHTEGLHAVLHHLIAASLRDRIEHTEAT